MIPGRGETPRWLAPQLAVDAKPTDEERNEREELPIKVVQIKKV
ncbi:MAG: hypothetical protein AAGM22_31705 [Acidobacteriota bacterium]